MSFGRTVKQILWKSRWTLIGAVVILIAALLVYEWLLGMLYFPTPCEATADAGRLILSKLTPEQAKTLHSVATLTDHDASCSSSFEYTSNGEDIGVWFLTDAIHGVEVLLLR